MCGIFGFYLKRKLVEKDINEGIKYLKLLNHRGPDDSGYWYDKEKGIFLGHNRLAIIDTSKKIANLLLMAMQLSLTMVKYTII